MRKSLVYIGLIIFAAILFIRVVYLNSDPVSIPFLDSSDEGLYSYASRSFYLTGIWATDNFNYGLIMPVFPPLQYLPVSIFGIHSYSFRAISVVLSLFTIIILYLFLKKLFDMKMAIIACLMLGFDFYYLVYSRSGLPEVTMLFFSLVMFIAWYQAIIAKKHNYIYASMSGIYFALAFFTKQSSVYLLFVVIGSVLFMMYKEKNKKITLKYIKILICFMIPVLVSFLLYTVFILLPNKTIWHDNYQATIGVNRLLKVFFTLPYLFNSLKTIILSDFWRYTPILTLGMILYSSKTIQNRFRKISLIEVFILLWLIGSLSQSIFMPSKWGRFMIISLFPMNMIFAVLIYKYKTGIFKIVLYSFFIIHIGYNLYLTFTYIILRPSYSYLDSISKLEKIIKPTDLSILPVHWIMNGRFNTLNNFLIQKSDAPYERFFRTYGIPVYLMIPAKQITDYRIKTPILYSRLEFIKEINGQLLFKFIASKK